jgi:flagellar hook-associated protein 3 FlgL
MHVSTLVGTAGRRIYEHFIITQRGGCRIAIECHAAGEGLITNQEDLTAVRAKVGYIEARIENAATRNESENRSLQFARGSLLGTDPYETATRLEEVQFQLQSLYAATDKTSQLSLVNFL